MLTPRATLRRISTHGVFIYLVSCVSLSSLLAGCAVGGARLAGMSDWSTLYAGQGTVETRVINESSEPITVRIQDEADQVVGQAPLPPRGTETLSLPIGPVHAVVRVIRDGHATYSEPKPLQVQVSPDHSPIEWRFSAPTVE